MDVINEVKAEFEEAIRSGMGHFPFWHRKGDRQTRGRGTAISFLEGGNYGR